MAFETYMNKANRDARVKRLKGQGFTVKKLSSRNQCLHPMYVVDYTKVTGRVLTAADKGFGNDIYKTHFPVLYSLELDPVELLVAGHVEVD